MYVTLIWIRNAENGVRITIVWRNGRREDTINKKWVEIKRTEEDKEEEEKEEEKGKDEEKEQQEKKDEEENKKIKRKHVIYIIESAIRRAESKFEGCRSEEHSAMATADAMDIKT